MRGTRGRVGRSDFDKYTAWILATLDSVEETSIILKILILFSKNKIHLSDTDNKGKRQHNM